MENHSYLEFETICYYKLILIQKWKPIVVKSHVQYANIQ